MFKNRKQRLRHLGVEMNVLVVNGSPKGSYSVTLYTALFLEKKFPAHKFTYINAGENIHGFEKDFSEASKLLKEADLVLFAYPVYTFLVPGQLHRFIELMKASGIDFSGKAMSQVTTSKHFYDVTAHAFMEENCHDMGFDVIRGLTADMDDILTPKGQNEAVKFMEYIEYAMKFGVFEPSYVKRTHWISVPVTEATDRYLRRDGMITIVADLGPENPRLADMIKRFRTISDKNTRVVNIREIGMKGGCVGCLNCINTGECIYQDDFKKVLNGEIHKSDAIVFAFTLKDHSMGSLFKMFDDRQFVNGHRTVTEGIPVAYIVNGNFSAEENLRRVIEARASVGGNYFVGVATDEADTNGAVDRLAGAVSFAIDNKMTSPVNFYGEGGRKIFRDLVYLMQGLMTRDHEYYKAKGLYDFPQKNKAVIRKMKIAGKLMNNEKLMAKAPANAIKDGMLKDYKKLIDSL